MPIKAHWRRITALLHPEIRERVLTARFWLGLYLIAFSGVWAWYTKNAIEHMLEVQSYGEILLAASIGLYFVATNQFERAAQRKALEKEHEIRNWKPRRKNAK